MSENYSASVSIDLEITPLLCFDPDFGASFGVGIAPIGGDEDSVVDVRLEHLVEELITDLQDTQDYSSLYCVAHEFSRLAEILREKAGMMEESLDEIGHLYRVDVTNLPDTSEGLPE
jgi:hypothetical protein